MNVRDAFLLCRRAAIAPLVAVALASCATTPAGEAELQLRVEELQKQLDEARNALALARGRPQPPGGTPGDLYEQARAGETEGRFAEAARLYRLSARQGNGRAAQRLGQIYGKGLPGVDLNYAESLKWCYTARALGEEPNCAAR
jgi:TPR repeat protein